MGNRGSESGQYRGRILGNTGVGKWASTGVGIWLIGGRKVDIAMIYKY